MELKDIDFLKHKDGGEVHKDGWGIRFEGAETCVYFEGDKEVGFEMSISGSPRRPTSFTAFSCGVWDHPHEAVEMTPAHWHLIKERLTAYLKFCKKWEPFVVEDW